MKNLLFLVVTAVAAFSSVAFAEKDLENLETKQLTEKEAAATLEICFVSNSPDISKADGLQISITKGEDTLAMLEGKKIGEVANNSEQVVYFQGKFGAVELGPVSTPFGIMLQPGIANPKDVEASLRLSKTPEGANVVVGMVIQNNNTVQSAFAIESVSLNKKQNSAQAATPAESNCYNGKVKYTKGLAI